MRRFRFVTAAALLADSVAFGVRPGAVAAVHGAPADTALATGASFTLREATTDRHSNPRDDPVTRTARVLSGADPALRSDDRFRGARFGERVAGWHAAEPTRIIPSLRFGGGAGAPSPAQRRDILFSNAVRFLRLPDTTVAAMGGRTGSR